MHLQRKVVLVTGKTGSGKSVLARSLSRRSARVLCIDPMHEHGGVVCTSARELLDMERRRTEEVFRYVCRFSSSEEVDIAMKLAWSMGNVLVFVDESDMYFEDENAVFSALIGQGRHRNVHLLCNTRRVVEARPVFRAQITSLFTFQHTEPIDLARLEDWGMDSERVEQLVPMQYPAFPSEGVNYMCKGEAFNEIAFQTTPLLSRKSYLEV